MFREKDTDTSIYEFDIHFPEEDLDDLYERIHHTRLGEDLEHTQFQYGFSVKVCKLMNYFYSMYINIGRCNYNTQSSHFLEPAYNNIFHLEV